MVRKHTHRLINAIEDGLLDKDIVLLAMVNYLSDAEVGDLAEHNDFFPEDNEEEDSE